MPTADTTKSRTTVTTKPKPKSKSKPQAKPAVRPSARHTKPSAPKRKKHIFRNALIGLVILFLIILAAYRIFLYKPPESYPNPTAVIRFSDNTVLNVELYPDIAPNTVANFIELAQSGFYNRKEVYRVVPGVLIQTGDPVGDGTGGAGYTIKGEFAANGFENNLSHARGVLSMARQSGYDTASSQFFILQGRYPQYDGYYAAFGQIIDEESLNALDKLANRNVDGHYVPLQRIYISSVTVDTYGAEYPVKKIEEDTKK